VCVLYPRGITGKNNTAGDGDDDDDDDDDKEK
jgi:hypothetical protein